jgi:hypothetical protein
MKSGYPHSESDFSKWTNVFEYLTITKENVDSHLSYNNTNRSGSRVIDLLSYNKVSNGYTTDFMLQLYKQADINNQNWWSFAIDHDRLILESDQINKIAHNLDKIYGNNYFDKNMWIYSFENIKNNNKPSIKNTCVMHMFDYDYITLLAHVPILAKTGISHILILSPAFSQPLQNGPLDWKSTYRPSNLSVLSSQYGTHDMFTCMCRAFKTCGIEVICDVVINHSEKIGDMPYGSPFNDPKYFSGADTNSDTSFMHIPFDSSSQVPLFSINSDGISDLNTTLVEYRSIVLMYLATLFSCGISSIRIDSATHMYPSTLNFVSDFCMLLRRALDPAISNVDMIELVYTYKDAEITPDLLRYNFEFISNMRYNTNFSHGYYYLYHLNTRTACVVTDVLHDYQRNDFSKQNLVQSVDTVNTDIANIMFLTTNERFFPMIYSDMGVVNSGDNTNMYTKSVYEHFMKTRIEHRIDMFNNKVFQTCVKLRNFIYTKNKKVNAYYMYSIVFFKCDVIHIFEQICIAINSSEKDVNVYSNDIKCISSVYTELIENSTYPKEENKLWFTLRPNEVKLLISDNLFNEYRNF